MKLMLAEGFNALLTLDKNLQHQQNFGKFNLPVLILNAPNDTYLTLKGLVPLIKEAINKGLDASGIEITNSKSSAYFVFIYYFIK